MEKHGIPSFRSNYCQKSATGGVIGREYLLVYRYTVGVPGTDMDEDMISTLVDDLCWFVVMLYYIHVHMPM